MIERFEGEFAQRFDARHAIAVSSGTAAVHLSVLAAGVTEGDFVITTPYSFIASANPILYERAIPIFVDIDPSTLTIDPAAAIEAMESLVFRRQGWERLLPPRCGTPTGKLRAIVPVDLFGRVAEMKELVARARNLGVAVVEDACEAIGASLDGVPAGRWGDAGTFGFFPNKQMTAGEGGLVLTDDDEWARTIRSLRNQGRASDENWLRHDRLGYNYRLDELSAAIGLAQLRRLDELLRARADVAAAYHQRLASIEGIHLAPAPREGMRVTWFVYTIAVDEAIGRDRLAARLALRGIETRPYFWPIHLQPLYRERFGFQPGRYPASEAAGATGLALPFHHELDEATLDRICEIVAEEAEACREEASARARRL